MGDISQLSLSNGQLTSSSLSYSDSDNSSKTPENHRYSTDQEIPKISDECTNILIYKKLDEISVELKKINEKLKLLLSEQSHMKASNTKLSGIFNKLSDLSINYDISQDDEHQKSLTTNSQKKSNQTANQDLPSISLNYKSFEGFFTNINKNDYSSYSLSENSLMQDPSKSPSQIKYASLQQKKPETFWTF